MKLINIFGILVVIMILALSGCNKTGEVVETGANETPVQTAEVAEPEAPATGVSGGNEQQKTNVSDLINKLSEEAGLPTETEETEEEETPVANNTPAETAAASGADHEISIDGFKEFGTITIKVGDTVKWTNDMVNYKNTVVILPKKNDSNMYEFKEINALVPLLQGDSYEFTFNKSWEYKWGSKTRFDKIYGFIKVE